MNTPELYEPEEPDERWYGSLEDFLSETVSISLVDYDQFWSTIFHGVHPLRTNERLRLLREVDSCGLRKLFFDDNGWARDAHFHFLERGTYARVLEAILGVMRDPVSAYEIYAAGDFQESASYLPVFQALFRSTEEPRSFGLWLMQEAYAGNYFAIRRASGQTDSTQLPDWLAERREEIGPEGGNSYIPNDKLRPSDRGYKASRLRPGP